MSGCFRHRGRSLRGCKVSVAVAADCEDSLVIVTLDRLEAPQDVGGLPERQPEIAPFERDVGEPDEGAAGRLLFPEPRVFG